MKYLKAYKTEQDYSNALQNNDVAYPSVNLVADALVDYFPSIETNVPLYIEPLQSLEFTWFSPQGEAIQYSKDGNTWVTLQSGQAFPIIYVGEKIYFKANLTAGNDGIGRFVDSYTIKRRFKTGGNIMSMVYKDNYKSNRVIPYDKCFKFFFYQLGVVDASKLAIPANSMPEHCCTSMFKGCKNLVNAPSLPATTLADSCYRFMLCGCTSLVDAPSLPAITLVDGCYNGLFEGCASLQYIKAMFTTAPSTTYTSGWVVGVPSGGKFVKNAAATWANSFGDSAIPTGWTIEMGTI